MELGKRIAKVLEQNNSFCTKKVNDFFSLITQLQSDTATNEKRTNLKNGFVLSSRGGRIRTCDLLVPNQAP